jgi:hypothetical protein
MARPSMLVKVRENEFKALLNRDETIDDVEEQLSRFSRFVLPRRTLCLIPSVWNRIQNNTS